MKFIWTRVAAKILPVRAAISCCMRAASEVDVEAISARLWWLASRNGFVILARCGATTSR